MKFASEEISRALSSTVDETTNATRKVAQVLDSIDEIDIQSIRLRPDTKVYLETLHGYLQCYQNLGKLYDEIDKDHILANCDMPDMKLPVQQQSIRGDGEAVLVVQNIVEVYEAAEALFPVFEQKVNEMLTKVKRDLNCNDDEIQFQLPPGDNKLKAKLRASQKIEDDYSKLEPRPPESWLRDVVRGSVLFSSAVQLLHFLETLRQEDSIKIIMSKNRFRTPALSGYRDWNLHIEITDENTGRKHICELQLHHKAIKEMDAILGSHKYYEFFRKYYAGGTSTLQERLDDLRMISDGNELNLDFLRNVVNNPLDEERMYRLADLFHNHVNEYQLALVIANAARRCPTTKEKKDDLKAFSIIANILESQGKLGEALLLHQRTQELQSSDDNSDTTMVYNNMALILLRLGQFDKAIDMFQDILRNLEENNRKREATYANLALVLQSRGNLQDLEEAKIMLQKALQMRLKNLGEDHASLATTYNNLAAILYRQDDVDQAKLMYAKALKIRLKALGEDHPATAIAYNNYAGVLDAHGENMESWKAYEKALDIQLRTLGEYHADTASTLHNIAGLLHHQEKHEEAMETYQKTLHIRKKVQGMYHPDTANTYNMIAMLLRDQGEFEQALATYHTVLEIRLKVLGEDHRDTMKTYLNISKVQLRQGKLLGALINYHKYSR